MEQQRELAKQTFIAGVNFAKEIAKVNAQRDEFLLTALADLMQIQCLKSDDMDLLRFALPSFLYCLFSDYLSSQFQVDLRIDY